MVRRLVLAAVLAATAGGFGLPSASAHCTVNVRTCSGGHCYVNAGTCYGSCYINAGYCGSGSSCTVNVGSCTTGSLLDITLCAALPGCHS